MSSGTRVDPYAAGKIAKSVGGKDAKSNIARLGLSPRQQDLNRLWAWYRCAAYDARRMDWDGKERLEGLAHEAVATAGFIPPGFYDAGSSFPIKFRRPTAPYALVKVIVDRFTGLLFSERHHPHVRVEGDVATEDYMNALSDAARLWPQMIIARAFGGAMGSVAIGFAFVQGKPVVEVHDPRWLVPDFIDRASLRLRSVEKRYQYPVETQNRETGEWEEKPYWYRRTIDEYRDVLYKPVKVSETGDEPVWEVQQEVAHGLGFCPVVWLQNLPVMDDVDGDPDCHGIYDTVESIDALLAQANRGVLANSDPTLKIITDAALSEVRKGSDNALKLPAGSSADYMELEGSGPRAAIEMADKLRTLALEVAQCVLDHPDGAQRTATEIERVYAAMLAKADILREQYGQKGVLPLLEMMARAAKALEQPVQVTALDADGNKVQVMQRRTISLPARVVDNADGTQTRTPRQLGPGGATTLQWPGYFAPSLEDITKSSDAAAKAKQAGLIDAEHASKFVADFFNVEDVQQMLAKIQAESEASKAAVEEQMMGGLGNGGLPAAAAVPPGGAPGGEEDVDWGDLEDEELM